MGFDFKSEEFIYAEYEFNKALAAIEDDGEISVIESGYVEIQCSQCLKLCVQHPNIKIFVCMCCDEVQCNECSHDWAYEECFDCYWYRKF